MTLTILTIDNNQLVAIDKDNGITVLRSTADIDALLVQEDDVMRSSSLDFPDDYTSDPAVLALVRHLNSLT